MANSVKTVLTTLPSDAPEKIIHQWVDAQFSEAPPKTAIRIEGPERVRVIAAAYACAHGHDLFSGWGETSKSGQAELATLKNKYERPMRFRQFLWRILKIFPLLALVIITIGPLNIVNAFESMFIISASAGGQASLWVITGENYKYITGCAAFLLFMYWVDGWRLLGCLLLDIGDGLAKLFKLLLESLENDAPPVETVPAVAQGREYYRKADTIYGDARSADDWEIDEALRDRRGGFGPMFKD